MRTSSQLLLLSTILISRSVCAAEIEFHRLQLESGIRVVIVHAPDAPRQTIFTFLPLTMANDDANRAQWSHLLEHMLIRSTDPIGLSADGVQFNGETTHIYLRLETFCEPDKWTDALGRHVKWLTINSFDAGILEREKSVIASEEQFTAQQGFTTKFALATWNQVVHHGAAHAAVHDDVANATAQDVEQYAARRVPADTSVLIATVGPLAADRARAEIAAAFGPIKSRMFNAPRAGDAAAADDEDEQEWIDGRSLSATWDLSTRHAMWFWRLPDRQPATLAAATVIAHSITSFFHTEVELHALVRQGLAYPCIDSPRGPVLLIDCCLHKDIAAADVWKRLEPMIAEMRQGGERSGMTAWLAPMLARQVDLAPNFSAIRQQLPPAMKDNAEGVWLLSLMNYEYAWGVTAKVVQESLANLNDAAVKSVQDALLEHEPCTLTLEPKAQQTNQ